MVRRAGSVYEQMSDGRSCSGVTERQFLAWFWRERAGEWDDPTPVRHIFERVDVDRGNTLDVMRA